MSLKSCREEGHIPPFRRDWQSVVVAQKHPVEAEQRAMEVGGMDSGVLKAGLRWFPAAGSTRRQMDPATNSQRTLLNGTVELQSARLWTAHKADDSVRSRRQG